VQWNVIEKILELKLFLKKLKILHLVEVSP
jgi:hypothetical protein